MPADCEWGQFVLIRVSVMSTEQKLSALKLNSDISLSSAYVAAIVCNQLRVFLDVVHC